MGLLKAYFRLSWIRLYFIILLLYLLTMLFSQSLVDETVYFNTYSEQLTFDRAVDLYHSMMSLSWVGYALFPFIILLKVLAVSMIIYTGVLLLNRNRQLTLGTVIRVVTGSEVIFVIAGVMKALWFCFFAENYTLYDLNFFYPFSLANMFKPDEVSALWIFPLQTVNLFNILYLLLLAYGIRVPGNMERTLSDRIVAGTYLPALVLWVAFIMFLSVSNSQ